MMGQNTPGALILLGLSYSSFSDLFGFMGHRLQSRLSLLHMEWSPTRYGDDPHSLFGMPQGPTRPEGTARRPFFWNKSPPSLAGRISVTALLFCSPAHVQAFLPESAISILLLTLQKYDFNATTPT
jgi:hypothetical protein